MPRLLSLAPDHPDLDVTPLRLERPDGATTVQHAQVPLFVPFLLPLHLPENGTTTSTRDAAMAE